MQAIHLKKAQNIEGSLRVAAALLDFSCQLHMFLATIVGNQPSANTGSFKCIFIIMHLPYGE